jgi:hypothetical protein
MTPTSWPLKVSFAVLFLLSAFLLVDTAGYANIEAPATSSPDITLTITQSPPATPAPVGTIVFRPSPIGRDQAEIVNPSRGYYRWRDQEIVPNGEPALDAYQRYSWIDLEASRGNYDFSQIEADVAQAASRDQKFGLRIRAMKDASSGGIYLPAYLDDCGWYRNNTFIPDWNASCFLDNAENLLQALAQRYDNDPRISWIDIGLYGNWGEWALPVSIYDDAPPGIQPATNDSLFRIVDMHLNAFPTVRKVMMAKTNEYAVAHALSASDQVGWRVDCLGKPGYFDFDTNPNYDVSWPYMRDRWQTAPVITEFCSPTSNGMDLSYQTAEEQVVEWHISMVGNGNTEDWADLSDEQQNNLQALGKKAGYRYQVNNVSIPSVLDQGQSFRITSGWQNLGVTPHYERVIVKFKLYQPNNGPDVWEGVSGIDLRMVLPGHVYTQVDALQLPNDIPAGSYELYVKVVDPASIRRPLRLAMEGLEQNGSYYLKDVVIR